MWIRYCKISLVFSCGLFFALVVLNNLTDYGSNFEFVENVLNMSTTFEGNALMWRAIESPVIHHIFYGAIIAWEATTMVLCFCAAYVLFRARGGDAAAFDRAKPLAVVALTVGMLLWFVAFITVGAEWFAMWQSPTWNGQNSAFRMFTIMGIILIFLSLPDSLHPLAEMDLSGKAT